MNTFEDQIREIRDKMNTKEITKRTAHIQLYELGLTKDDIAAITNTAIQNVHQNIQHHKQKQEWEERLKPDQPPEDTSPI